MSFINTAVVMAQDVDLTEGLTTPDTFEITELIGWAIQMLLIVAGVIFFFMLVIGGVQWILSGGDKAKTESARGQITAALVGLVIVFAAWAIVTLVNAFFGINLFNLTVTNI